MATKNLRLKKEDLIELIKPMGYCYASDKITVEGCPVGYMYRETPIDKQDSGWRFFSGTEDDDYLDDEDNIEVYEVNTIANYDKAIIPYLDAPYETDLERIENADTFEIVTD
ncbi:MAG: DUF2185 domain-containing protein [Flavobacteriaceae bacterium]